MKPLRIPGLFIIWIALIFGCGPNRKEKALIEFIEDHVKKVKPLEKARNLANWEAETTGNEPLYKRTGELELELRKIYSNPEDFKKLKAFKSDRQIKDPLLIRQLNILYNEYLINQIEPDLLKEIVDLSTQVTKQFNTFRSKIRGKEVTSNEIDEILKTEKNSQKRKDAWLASKQIGPEIEKEVIQLVKLRNRAAQKLGFDNYHTMSLSAAEQDIAELDQIFNKLYDLTDKPFAQLKQELDSILVQDYRIAPEKLMPWHYHDPFFQESPLVYDLDLDLFYDGKDIAELGTGFYKSIGLSVEQILEASDLYERDGKNPHAFCTDIDREGDVRILCNLKSTERWMETMLHELGHGVYDLYIDTRLPFILRQPAHTLTTEAIAMFFGRLSRNPSWMQQMLNLNDNQRIKIEEVGDKYARLKQIIFARWAMVMIHFEKELYGNPDQDLNMLWWDLVEKYQMIQRPRRRNHPDWAAKIHIALYPCYYHNYLLGELLASQLHHHLLSKIPDLSTKKDPGFTNQKQVGEYLRKNVFAVGAKYQWNEMIKRAMGEPLNPSYFVNQFIK